MSSFARGSSVRVKEGIRDSDSGLDMSGWQGRVQDLDSDGILTVHWDSLTLNGFPPDYLTLCETEGWDWATANLLEEELEPTPTRDSEDDVDDAVEALRRAYMWSGYGETGERVKRVLGELEPDDVLGGLNAWEAHLRDTLRFPLEAKGISSGSFASLKRVTLTSIHSIDPEEGVMVLLEGHPTPVPLAELRAVRGEAKGWLEAYGFWLERQ